MMARWNTNKITRLRGLGTRNERIVDKNNDPRVGQYATIQRSIINSDTRLQGSLGRQGLIPEEPGLALKTGPRRNLRVHSI